MVEEAKFSKMPDALLPEYDISQKSAAFNLFQECLKFHVTDFVVMEVLMFHQIGASNDINNGIRETAIYTWCQISVLFSVWFNKLLPPWVLFSIIARYLILLHGNVMSVL